MTSETRLDDRTIVARGAAAAPSRGTGASAAAATPASCRSPLGTYPECPLCGGALFPEHAHFKCSGCGWRDSCCD